LRICCLTPYLPDPLARHAGGQFLARYLGIMAADATVEVFAPNTPDNRDALDRAPQGVAAHVVNVRLPAIMRSKFARRGSNALAGVSPGPGVLRSFMRDARLRSSLAMSDLVELQFAAFSPFIKSLRLQFPAKGTAVFVHDVAAQSLQRQAHGPGSLYFRLGAAIACWRARRVEPDLYSMCDIVFVWGEKDRSLLLGLGVRSPIRYIPPDVEVPPESAPLDGPPTVLFTGAMWRRENSSSCIRFIEEAWPLVREAVPEATFVVAGAAPPNELLDRNGSDGLVITGFVPDLAPLYHRATCFVAPLQLGAGVKFKVLHAMAHGLPIIATPIATEGIDGPAAEISSDLRILATATIACLEDRDQARLLGGQGRRFVEEHYDFEGGVSDVLDRYRDLIAVGS
jgi:glycosyltransferase involved in cell wall biosynthesis